MTPLPPAYSDLVSATVDLQPKNFVWRASDLAKLTFDQIKLISEARPVEFSDKFAKSDFDPSDFVDDLTKPAIVLQARILSALEWAARQVLFDDAQEEAERQNELDSLEDSFGDKADAAMENRT